MSDNKKFAIALLLLTIISTITLLIIYICKDKYDVSHFNNVNVNDVLQMFDTPDTNIVFIGSPLCNDCNEIIKILKNVQKEKNITINYLKYDDIDFNSNNGKKLVDKFNIKITESIDNTEKNIENNTFGYFLEEGLVPMVIVIEDSKQKGGFIGSYPQKELNGWFNYILNS